MAARPCTVKTCDGELRGGTWIAWTVCLGIEREGTPVIVHLYSRLKSRI